MLVFDRMRVRANRERAAARPVDFLHQWAMRALAGRLDVVKRDFQSTLLMGATGLGAFSSPQVKAVTVMDCAALPGIHVQADGECLPFHGAGFDLVLSCLDLHTANDLPGALVQIRRALKPDGLFLGAMAGGETLHELRQVLAEAEMAVRGGASPRVFPFADKPQAGALLQRAGLALPVVDSEIVTVTYENAFRLLHDIRGMGEGNAILERDKRYPGRALFLETARLYREKFSEPDGRIHASFEIIFMIGWAPHESQQKSLPRGSAKQRLADALGTREMPANEKTPA